MARQTSKWLKQMTVYIAYAYAISSKMQNFPFNPIVYMNMDSRMFLYKQLLPRHYYLFHVIPYVNELTIS
jgi:hypothetical protein